MASESGEPWWVSKRDTVVLVAAGVTGVALLAYYLKVRGKDDGQAEVKTRSVNSTPPTLRSAAPPPPPVGASASSSTGNGKANPADEKDALSALQQMGVLQSASSVKDRFKVGEVGGKTLLHTLVLAESQGEADANAKALARLLELQGGRDLLSVKDDAGNSCLHQAAGRPSAYHAPLLSALLAAAPPALLGETNNLGQAPLHCAQCPEIAALLVEKDPALLRAVDEDGDTVLHAAAAQGHETLVQFLLEKDPSLLSVKNKSGSLALHSAVVQQQAAVALMLADADRTTLEATSNEGFCPVHLACAAGNLDMVVKLVERRRKTAEMLDNDGNSCLHYAAEKGNSRLAAFLAALSSPLLAVKNKDGKTCLDIAEEHGRDETVRVLRRFLQEDTGSRRSTPTSSPGGSRGSYTPTSSRTGPSPSGSPSKVV